MLQTKRYLLSDVLREKEISVELVGILNRGGVGVYPTETIYGIGGRADREEVRQQILDAKRRPADNPMILIAADRTAFAGFGISFPEAAERLAQRFWPGNLTLVLPASGNTTVGIRVSDHPFIQMIGKVASYPLFSTSANVSGQGYDGSPEKLRELFDGTVDFIVDAGELPKSLPSTVVKVDADGSVTVIRDGAIPAADITGKTSPLGPLP